MPQAAQAREPRPGDLQVGAWSEYEPGQPGFVIEEFGYSSYHSDPPGWRIPAWDERGEPQFEGVFPTYAEAAYILAREA
jgi:hypothetical protein